MNVDCIILTNSSDPSKISMTKRTILTLKDSEPDINFKVTLVESGINSYKLYSPIVDYYLLPNEPFNYNKFLNLAFQNCKEDWVIISNNDVGYENGWFTEILNVYQERPDIESFSPKDPLLYMKYFDWHFVGGNAKYYESYKVTEAVMGWCLVVKSDALRKILPLDEIFDMYYQDNDYAEVLKEKGIKHALVRNSIACHLQTLNIRNMTESQMIKFSQDEQKFRKKWNQ